jgi:PAS domain S-box-containing protein
MRFMFKKKAPAAEPHTQEHTIDATPPAATAPAPSSIAQTKPDAPSQPTSAAPPIATQAMHRQDRSLYRALLAGLYDAVLIIDPKGFIIGSNPRVETFFGYTEADLWDKACVELIPKMTPKVQAKIRIHTESGRFTVVNATGHRKDGGTFPAEIAISRIHLLHEGDLIFSIRNLERREKARVKHEMALEALQSCAAGVVVCRTDGRVEFVNPAFLQLLQYEEEKDVLKGFIGDFCTCVESATAMVRTPSSHGTWMGTIGMNTNKGIARDFLATSAMKTRKRGESHLVITLTPLPRAVVAD